MDNYKEHMDTKVKYEMLMIGTGTFGSILGAAGLIVLILN